MEPMRPGEKQQFDLAVDVEAHKISASNRDSDSAVIKHLRDERDAWMRVVHYIVSQVGPVTIPDSVIALRGRPELFTWPDHRNHGTVVSNVPREQT